MKKSGKRKKPKIYSKPIQKSLFKMMAVLMLVVLNVFWLSNVMSTLAYYNDQEQSPVNFTASIIDFSLSSQEDFSPVVTPNQTADKSVTISNDSGFDLQHDLTLGNFTGDSNLCDNLMLSANIGGSDIYSGRLLDFMFTTTTLAGSSFALLELEAFLAEDDAALKNKTCNFDLNILGWQINSAAAGQGFTDNEKIANSISSGDWVIEIPPTPVAAGDVVINEIMWSGSSGDADDEWIELRNMTDYDIDLSNWNINNAGMGSGPGAHLEIPHGYSIKAHGYFLITNNKWDETAINLIEDLANDEGLTHKPGLNLKNSGEELILKDKDNNVIDTAWQADEDWPAGSNGAIKKSMERNNIPGAGALASSWHTCEDGSSTALYWDAGRTELGTPGADNLSVNDSSSLPILSVGYGLGSEAADEAPVMADSLKELNTEPAELSEGLISESISDSDQTLSDEDVAAEEDSADDSNNSNDQPNNNEPATEPTPPIELPIRPTPTE